MAAHLQPRQVGQPDVQEDDVGLEGRQPRGGVERRRGDLHVVVVVEGVLEQFQQVLVVVHDQHPGTDDAPEAGEMILLHEALQALGGDPAVLGAGERVAVELAAVDPLDDGPLGDLADAGHFPGRIGRRTRFGYHI